MKALNLRRLAFLFLLVAVVRASHTWGYDSGYAAAEPKPITLTCDSNGDIHLEMGGAIWDANADIDASDILKYLTEAAQKACERRKT